MKGFGLTLGGRPLETTPPPVKKEVKEEIKVEIKKDKELKNGKSQY